MKDYEMFLNILANQERGCWDTLNHSVFSKNGLIVIHIPCKDTDFVFSEETGKLLWMYVK